MKYEDFYLSQYDGDSYAGVTDMESHPFYDVLSNWLCEHEDLKTKRFLEIGSGRGALQDIVEDYTGVDYAGNVRKYYHKPFFESEAENLPFDNNTFDVVFSYAVWEHIPDPEKAFAEVVRVTKPGGYFVFLPAWHCKPWFAKGYLVRPYSDFNLAGKIYKLFIPALNALPLRTAELFFKRTCWYLKYLMQKKEFSLPYRKLQANYEKFWQSDSDACNDLDSFPVILWFYSRRCACISHPMFRKAFLGRTGKLEIVINKN